MALIATALASAATVLSLDECDLQRLPLVRALWMQGPRVRLPTPGTNAKRAFFGALDARTGALHDAVPPKKLAVSFVACLEQLAQQAAPLHAGLPHRRRGAGARQRDHARCQRRPHRPEGTRLAQPNHARVRLLWLPKDRAHEHNPIERVWGLLKDAVAANRLAGSMDALVAEAHRFFATTRFAAPQPATAPLAAAA